jgi:hypothetical protein
LLRLAASNQRCRQTKGDSQCSATLENVSASGGAQLFCNCVHLNSLQIIDGELLGEIEIVKPAFQSVATLVSEVDDAFLTSTIAPRA